MVNKVIVSIGADSTGKTEISKQLCNMCDFTYYKNKFEGQTRFTCGEDPKLAFKYETQTIFNFIEQLPDSISLVLDRGIPCEYVYAKTLNRPFDEDLVWYYDKKLAEIDARFLYFYKTEYEKPFEDEFVSEDIQSKVCEYYDEYLSKTKCKFAKIDTTSCDLCFEIYQIFDSGILN